MFDDTYRKLRVRFGPRRFRAYGVGPGKSGTHSLANLLRPYYRSAHEPEPDLALRLLLRLKAGAATEDDVIAYLRDKDRRLRLEMDCASYNALMARHLVGMFPNAKFILSVRDCFSWANSAINQMLNNRNVSAHWAEWRTALYGPIEACNYAAAEVALKEHRMWNLDSIFRVWADHYRTVLDTVPMDRLLILGIDDLGQRNEVIAEFLGVSPSTLSTAGSRDFQTPRDFGLLAKIDPSFVTARAQAICGDLMREFYPDTPCDYLAFRARPTKRTPPPSV